MRYFCYVGLSLALFAPIANAKNLKTSNPSTTISYEYIYDNNSSYNSSGSFKADDSQIEVNGWKKSTDEIKIYVRPNNSYSYSTALSFVLGASKSNSLSVGHYEKAKSTRSNSHPELYVSKNSRACEYTTGTFDILELEYDSAGRISKFAANVMQVCAYEHYKFYSEIRYNSTLNDDLKEYIASFKQKSGLAIQSFKNDGVTDGTSYKFSNNANDYSTSIGRYYGPQKIEISTTELEPKNNVDTYISLENWKMTFANSSKTTLTKGYYPDAIKYSRYSSNTSTSPQMLVQRGYSYYDSCKSIDGRFKVTEADYDKSNNIKHLAIVFEQYCGTKKAPLIGRILYHANNPPAFIEVAQYQSKTHELDIPLMLQAKKQKHIVLSRTSLSPLTFKVTKVSDAGIAKDEIKSGALFDSTNKELVIPTIEYHDEFGAKHTLKNVTFTSTDTNLKKDDLLTLKNNDGKNVKFFM